jgi:ABC-type nitrate/sulfonate/bicarbonate transport system substrate-binding protein
MLNRNTLLSAMVAILLVACQSGNITQSPSFSSDDVAPTNDFTQTAITPELVPIKLGIQTFSSNLPLYLASVEGYFVEQGLDVELVLIESSTDILAATLTGDIDIAGSTVSIAQFNAITQGAGLRFVADKGYLNPEGCSYASFLVRNAVLDEGRLQDVSDLTNLLVNPSTRTLITPYALDKILGPAGLDLNDLQTVDIPQQNLLEALANGSLDVTGTGEPWLTRILDAGVARTWVTFESILPETELALLWYGPTITQQNREAGNRFMVAYLKAVRQYNEGKTDRNVELMAEFTGLDIEEARRSCWQSIHSDGRINVQSLLDMQSWAVETGQLDAVVPVEEFWDGSFVEYAQGVLD